VDAEEESPVEKPPVLSYSVTPRDSIAKKVGIATNSAAGFLGIAVIWCVLLSPVSNGAMLAVILVACIPIYIIAAFSCWIRLSISAKQLERRRRIWPITALYAIVTTCLVFVGHGAHYPGLEGFAAAIAWVLAAPCFACFFLLRPTAD
jgi:hypothetical protein